jgi:D-glycero-beta-D-manno-heptose 1-phosphate adenylyltransferase
MQMAAAQANPFDRADRTEAITRLRDTLPRPLVFTYGVFDVLHGGHLHLFEQARARGASLVVGVHGDHASRRLRKGPGQPVNSAAERARLVAALGMVSAAVTFDEDKPLALICALRPDIVVKAGSPSRDGHVAQCALLAEWGGQAVLVPRLPGCSTAALVERLRPLACRVRLSTRDCLRCGPEAG